MRLLVLLCTGCTRVESRVVPDIRVDFAANPPPMSLSEWPLETLWGGRAPISDPFLEAARVSGRFPC